VVVLRNSRRVRCSICNPPLKVRRR
jgi:LSD1 subclass zinc finger protein